MHNVVPLPKTAVALACTPPQRPTAPQATLVHFIQACLLSARIHGTASAVKETAYKVGLNLSWEHQQTAALVINSADALDLVYKFEDIYME